MSIIIPANSAVAGGYDVENSCRFDGTAAYLNRTQGTSTNLTKFAWSGWIKRSKLGADQTVTMNYASASNYGYFYFRSGDDIRIFDRGAGGDTVAISDMLFRDTSAWYHIALIIDTTQATDTNRLKLYVNGILQGLNGVTYPAENAALGWKVANTSNTFLMRTNSADGYVGGYLAEVAYVDGTANAITDFGEFDEDSGIWKPIDVSGLTFGNEGYYLDFKDSANLGNDVTGGTDFTENSLAAIDQTTDTCTNNFATGNILSPYANRTITDGSLTITSTTTQWTNICSTIGVSSGKWWIELKHTAGSYGGLGIVSPFPQTENNVIGDFSAPVIQQIGYVAASGDKKINNSTSSYGSTWVGTGDIVNMSLNLDDNELKFYKNGTVQDSGTAIAISSGYTYFVGTSNYNSSGSSFNFGNPAFSISSGNADANGYGNFEYAPPAGFLALCTKNLSGELS